MVVEAPARPVLIGNTFGDNGGEPVRLPEGMDAETITKFNFFLQAPKPPVRNRRGASP